MKLGVDYPERIVDINKTRTHALNTLYAQRKNERAQQERLRILKTHTIRKPSDKDDARQI